MKFKIIALTPTKSPFSINRPTLIMPPIKALDPTVGLFGTCGAPESTWRDDFIAPLKELYIDFYNPQKKANEWDPKVDPAKEASHLAKDAIIVLPVSKETDGFGSLAEIGWAILGAMLRGQHVGVFVELDGEMSDAGKRTRLLSLKFLSALQNKYPIFRIFSKMQNLANWTVFKAEETKLFAQSELSNTTNIQLTHPPLENRITIVGTSSQEVSKKTELIKLLNAKNMPIYDSYIKNWDDNMEQNIDNELKHKRHDKVILSIITGDTEGFGSLAESGLLALNAMITGQAYGLYIEDHPSPPNSATNRTRTLVKAHIAKLNQQFPNTVFLANSMEELAAFAVANIQ